MSRYFRELAKRAKVGDSEINLMPTEGMRTEAQRYKDWKADGKPGGTDVAASRANQILSGEELSPAVAIEMNAWFARHEVDKKGKGFTPGDNYPSPGRVAWAAWGGDAGQSWSAMKSSAIKKAQERSMEPIVEGRPYPNEHAARLKEPGQYDSIRRVNNEGGEGVDFIYGIKDGTSEIQAIRFDADRFSPAEARKWLTDHDFNAISFETATIERSEEEMRKIEGESFQRALVTDFRAAGEERTIEFPFASEAPVERYFGMEVLSMDESAMDLSRLNDGAPLLFQHDPDRIVGVVERAYIKDKRGYAKVKMANNDLGREMQELIKDGILRNVSFGYRINSMETDNNTDPITYRATSYQPFEISLVTVPADQSVGIGRTLTISESSTTASAVTNSPLSELKPVEPTFDMEAIRAEAAQAKAKELSEMIALGNRTNNSDMAQEFITNSRGLDELRTALLEKMSTPAQPVDTTVADIGLSKEETRSFSFLRAINYLANPADRQAREAAGFEIEASEAAAAKLGRQSRGITIPQEVLRRDLSVGVATAGGNLVATELDSASFIDLLRNASALDQAGATVLTGLVGNVAIPRQSGAGTGYWVSEAGAPTESQQTVDQVSMTPKTVAAFTDYSRRLMLQSSIDIENMVRRDLAAVLGLKIDAAGLYGTGSNSEPLGLKNTTGIGTEDFAADAPTFAEVVAMESDVATANALLGSPVYLMNAAMRGNLKTTKKDAGSGIFLMEGGEVNGYRGVLSNQVASGDLWFGNFADLLIGYWSGLDIMVDPYTNSTSGTVRVVAMQDVDVAIRHPESFSRGNNTL
jgi:HK97 family phage major capsid protein/HK97 family phage prohead protease